MQETRLGAPSRLAKDHAELARRIRRQQNHNKRLHGFVFSIKLVEKVWVERQGCSWPMGKGIRVRVMGVMASGLNGSCCIVAVRSLLQSAVNFLLKLFTTCLKHCCRKLVQQRRADRARCFERVCLLLQIALLGCSFCCVIPSAALFLPLFP